MTNGDFIRSMTDEDIDTMAALLKTLRDAPHASSPSELETPASGPGTLPQKPE